jgi:hypothetical protein
MKESVFPLWVRLSIAAWWVLWLAAFGIFQTF